MSRHPWNRLLAWLVDWACIVGWVAITAAVGVPLFLAGVTRGLSIGALNVIAALVLVVPVTVALAWLESSRPEATIGKRARRLAVVTVRTGQRISFGRALARNALKITVPWVIGHAVVFAIVVASPSDTVPPSIWLAIASAYVLPVGYLISLFVGSGRTPYDRIVGTVVVGRPRKPHARRAWHYARHPTEGTLNVRNGKTRT